MEMIGVVSNGQHVCSGSFGHTATARGEGVMDGIPRLGWTGRIGSIDQS
jgi:hypothetical protein